MKNVKMNNNELTVIENGKKLAILKVESKIIELSRKYINDLPYKFLLELSEIFEERMREGEKE